MAHQNLTTSLTPLVPFVDTSFVHGCSPAIRAVNARVREIAATNITVLLFGESGSGKEVYGRLIHRLSKNCQKPLKKLNCRALDSGEFCSQLQSSLSANGNGCHQNPGTVFLDGVDELDLSGQRFLLSLLPDGDVEESSSRDVRLIASTCQDLEKGVEAGGFRRELYFRISGVCLRLPPLRDRREDIPLLIGHFLAKHSADLGRDVPKVSDQQIETLEAYNWPGNIRELENLARNIVLLGNAANAIDDIRDKPKLERAATEEPHSFSLKVAAKAASRQAERDLIAKALERTRWNRKRAARDLQISYKSLLYKIKQTGLDKAHKENGVEGAP